MLWQSKAHQGTATLDSPMAEKVGSYLESRESQLGSQVVSSIHLFQDFPPHLEYAHPSFLRLSDAVELFGKKIHAAAQSHRNVIPTGTWENTVKEVNQALWAYVEVLEECVNELFQQMDQIGFEQWNDQVVQAAEVIRDNLAHRIEDLLWAIRRIEEQLKEFRSVYASKTDGWEHWKNKMLFWAKPLDASIENTLKKCKKYLNVQFQKFMDRYLGFLQLKESAQHAVHLLQDFKVFNSLEPETQEKLKKIYSLLEIWNLNKSSKTLGPEEPMRAIRLAGSPESFYTAIGEYYKALRKSLFGISRAIKVEFPSLFLDDDYRKNHIELVTGLRKEINELRMAITKYANFLHEEGLDKSKIRSGILHLLNKESPIASSALSTTLEKIDDLDYYCEEFLDSIEHDPSLDSPITVGLENDVDQLLHEMGQPLTSKDMMRRRVEAFIDTILDLDELGTCHTEVIDYLQGVLCKGMRLDWKYHALQEIPAFHRIIDIHHQLALPRGNSQYSLRIQKLNHLLEQMSHWISQNEVVKKLKEIEFDLNDIKSYLQDFYAAVQRLETSADKDSIFQAKEALLEYLYTFGKFFHQLKMEIPEHRFIRKQMYFVDQYFDAIDAKLSELSNQQK